MHWKFCKLSNTDRQALDEDQASYRKHFGIVDKYLIKKTDDYIIYIDFCNDIDWIDCRDLNKYPSVWTKENIDAFNAYTARLDQLQSMPSLNLDEKAILTYKKMLGTAYCLAFEANFARIEQIITDATTFLNNRNKEKSRQFFLEFSLVVTLLSLIVYCWQIQISHVEHSIWCHSIFFGICGSFVSIWTRYGKLSYTGLSSRRLHYLEAFSRQLVGALFAVVALLAMRCGLVFSGEADKDIYAVMLISFVAGFSERFVPSLMERIVKDETDKN